MKIKNWHKFQHFKDRRPPWIKLHREILDDYDINMISSDAFRFLIQLWLIASEDETMQGSIPSIEQLSFRLRLSKNKCLELLRQVDIFLISSEYQNDLPETETETETEKSMSGKPDPILSDIQKETKQDLVNQARTVLDFMNLKTGRNYQPVEANISMICARLKEGTSLQDCKSVIAKKCREWATDEKMNIYLRPKTIFNKINFAQYVGELKREVVSE